jgi:hypothetical protein
VASPAILIRAFGLFWERDQIDWGSRGRAGHLLGYRDHPGTQIDFRDQRGIYVLYEGASIAHQRVVYLGQAGAGTRSLFHRLRDHRDDELWNRWQRFSWFGLLGVGTGGALVHSKKGSVGGVLPEFRRSLSASL